MRKPSRKRGHTHQLVEALQKHTVGISGKAARQYHSSNKFTYRRQHEQLLDISHTCQEDRTLILYLTRKRREFCSVEMNSLGSSPAVCCSQPHA